MTPVIRIRNLTKAFKTRITSPGISGAVKALFTAPIRETFAINHINLDVNKGERLAFIGPNGAGKSTTIKILTGILHPTSGEVDVLGLTPWKQRHTLGFKIGTVFGQRSQLWYHLPPTDTFNLLSKIYEIDHATFKKRLNSLVDDFAIRPLLNKPVKQMSLGERMRCEIVASLLHQPEILFLDEPTIGLDINAKLGIRSLLNTLSRDRGTTLFLTSHDTADIEQVCDRVVVLDKGTIISDAPLKNLKKKFMATKVLRLLTDAESMPPLNLPGITVIENGNHNFTCEINTASTPIEQVIQRALALTQVKDITIEDPSMEEVIRLLYKESAHG